MASAKSSKERKRAPLKGGHKAHFDARNELRAKQQTLAGEYRKQDNDIRYEGEYTDALGQHIADLLVEGMFLDYITALPGMPPLRVMLRWIQTPTHPFYKIYREAKGALVPLFEERALSAATTPLIGKKKVRKGVVTKDGEIVEVEEEYEDDNVERSKLMAATYQWTLQYTDPRRHGRNANPDGAKPNNQLQALFDSLASGPVNE